MRSARGQAMSVPVPPPVVLSHYRHLSRGVQSLHWSNTPAKIGNNSNSLTYIHGSWFTSKTQEYLQHLQLCGHPIANDPCYGGRLFFNDHEKRDTAVAALQYMKVHHITPLSKVPHFDGAELIASPPHTGEQVASGSDAEVKQEPPSQEGDSGDMKQRIGEADDDYLIRTCRFVVVIILFIF